MSLTIIDEGTAEEELVVCRKLLVLFREMLRTSIDCVDHAKKLLDPEDFVELERQVCIHCVTKQKA